MNLQEIKELVRLINDTDIHELALENNGIKVAIRKGPGGAVNAAGTAGNDPGAAVAEDAAPPYPGTEGLAGGDLAAGEDLHRVNSPMVGTFYSAPSPDAPPFVREGDTVAAGQVLCIVEAMKLMNEIESEVSGQVLRVHVENGAPVEYGQQLFLIRPGN